MSKFLNSFLVFCFATLMCAGEWTFAQSTSAAANASQLVSADQKQLRFDARRLGRSSNEVMETVARLAKKPREATALLIAELHPVRETKIVDEGKPNTEHVLWCIRALRYITGGKDFCAPTNHRFGGSESEQDRKYWLYVKDKKCVTFFALWPSHGVDYVAPQDAQIEIIRQWKEWYRREGETFAYRPFDRTVSPKRWSW